MGAWGTHMGLPTAAPAALCSRRKGFSAGVARGALGRERPAELPSAAPGGGGGWPESASAWRGDADDGSRGRTLPGCVLEGGGCVEGPAGSR